jgi:hypothetical protein
LQHLVAEKDRRIAGLEADADLLREERNRMWRNWQDERIKLLQLIEDQTDAVKLLTRQRPRQTEQPQQTLWRRLFGASQRFAEAA